MPSDWNALCAFALVCLKPGPSVRPQRRGINDPQIKLPPHPFLIKNDFSAGNSTFHPLYDHAPSGFSTGETAFDEIRFIRRTWLLKQGETYVPYLQYTLRYTSLRYPQTYVLTFFSVTHFLSLSLFFSFLLILGDNGIKKVRRETVREREREESEGVDIVRVTIHRPTRVSQATKLPTVKHAPL